MKSSKALGFLCVVVLLPSLQASTKHHKTRGHAAATRAKKADAAATSITLQDGRHARIENGRVMLAQTSGKYVAAPAGRYTTRDGKLLLVGNEGRLISGASLKVGTAPQPEVKRTAPTNNRQYHQTGTNL